MRLEPTPLTGCYIVHATAHADDRGNFMRSFDALAFKGVGLASSVFQTAESYNAKRLTLRGMHFQSAPVEEAKLVRCINGAMFDVAVDLRENSPSFKRWFGVYLGSDTRTKALFIPAGFAHGFLTLRDETLASYHLFAPYEEALQGGFRFDDPDIGIEWPKTPLIIGDRDLGLPAFSSLSLSFHLNAL
jgi:dTDP-4-dehydrorhamnose 3,5-epimerase